jgi:fermentation-respiration switch protein FrsA (DUF1100 family)
VAVHAQPAEPVQTKPGEKVWFHSGTTRIAGLLWVPEDIREGERLPAIVIARGFGSVKEFVNPGFAPVLNRAGFVVLGFDYPGLGESGGVPGRLIPTEHAESIRAGISFLQAHPSVDPEKIGLLGDSMGGAHVLYAAAFDPRAKCVISYGGPGDGDRWFRSLMGYERYLKWRDMIDEERRKRTLTGEATYVSAFDFLAFSEKERAEWAELQDEFPTTHPPITIETAEKYLEYKPEAVVAQISPRPVFFVTAATSVIVPPDESIHLFEAAKEPKKLWIIPPSGASFRYATHLKGHGYAAHVAKAFIDWFTQWIPPERAGSESAPAAAAATAGAGTHAHG